MKKIEKDDYENLIISAAISNALFNQQMVGVLISDDSGKIIQVNEKVISMLGYTAEEFKRLGWYILTHKDDLELDKDNLLQLMGGKFNEYMILKRYIKKDGDEVPVSICVKRLNGGVVPKTMYVCIIQELYEVDNKYFKAKLIYLK